VPELPDHADLQTMLAAAKQLFQESGLTQVTPLPAAHSAIIRATCMHDSSIRRGLRDAPSPQMAAEPSEGQASLDVGPMECLAAGGTCGVHVSLLAGHVCWAGGR
jgi:hypothetical protein